MKTMGFENDTIYSGLSSADYDALLDLGIPDLNEFLGTLTPQDRPDGGGTWYVYNGDGELMLLIYEFTGEEYDILTYAFGNSTWVMN